MAANGKPSPLRFIRPVLLLAILGGGGYAIWKYQTRQEGYRGGDVVTTGTIEAVHVRLAFKVGGRIQDVPVTEGTDVKPGQLIGRLETQDLENAVQSAEAALGTAQAGILEVQANREKTARDFQRIQSLMPQGAATPQQLDAARAAMLLSAAQEHTATERTKQAAVALAQAKLQLSYAELRAPEAGEISEKIHRPGELVMAGAPVVTVAQMDTVKVHAAVDETRVGAVRPGDPVRVKVYTFDRQVFPGVVTDIQPAGDFATRKDWGAQRRDIRTFTVTALLPNPEHVLKDGMTAEVTIAVSPTVQKMVGREK